MSSTLGVRQWFPAAATSAAAMTGELARHAREFGIAFVGDDDEEDGLLKKECLSPSLPPIPPLIPLSSVRHSVAVSDDSSDNRLSEAEPAGYGGVFMVNSDSPTQDHDECVMVREEDQKLLRIFGDSDSCTGAVSGTAEYERLHGVLVNETDECGEEQHIVKVSSDMCSDGGCCNGEASRCKVVLDPLPTDLLRSLTEEGRISAVKASRTCCHSDWEHNDEALPLDQCSSESAVRGLLRDLVSAVVTQEGDGGQEAPRLARCQRQESLLHQPPPPPSSPVVAAAHDNPKIDYDDIEDCRDEESRDDTQWERKSRHRKSETPRKAVRRRRERRSSSSGKNKRRKRSTSCSTTSSTGSTASNLRHHHHHKHHKHRRRMSKASADEQESTDPPPTPRVNPIFVWVKQDDTRIVEVLCEDYDKRNRIRLTKTAHGWRAIPRTERLASASSVTSSTAPTVPSATTAGGSSSTSNSCAEAPLEEEQYDNLPTDSSIDNDVASPLVSTGVVHPISPPIDDENSTDPITKDEEPEGEIENEAGEDEVEDYIETELQQEETCDNAQSPIANDCAELHEYTETEVEEVQPTDLSIPKPNIDVDVIRIPTVKPITPILPAAPTHPKISPVPVDVQATPVARPAHQPKPQHKSMFLESLLSSPRKCHQLTRCSSKESNDEPQPLDLGVSQARSSGSPTVSCSDEKKPLVRPANPDPEVEPKIKCLKVEDITLKNLLSKHSLNKTINNSGGMDKSDEKNTHPQAVVETTKTHKSRLLELLTSEPASVVSSLDEELDPLTQLKKITSDPELSIPNPLLVPRDRLHSLVASPAREIPHLLSTRPDLRLPDALTYPALLRDPDLLVVSLAQLQRLLQKPENWLEDNTTYITLHEWQRYQSQQQQHQVLASELESQMKQQQQNHNNVDLTVGELDAATATALSQMMWLPYLTQLEAAALACGNNHEFLTMLNAVFPSSNIPQVQRGSSQQQYPFLPGVTPFTLQSADYKTQMELQQTLALWQEAMMQAAVTANSVNNNNSSSNNNNNILSSKTTSGTNSKNHHNHHPNNGRLPHVAKKFNSSSARTSPISPNFQPQHHQQQRNNSIVNNNNHHEYLSASGFTPSSNNHHHQYNQQRSRQQPIRNNSGPQKVLKSEIQTPIDNDNSNNKITPKPKITCKSLINLLSSSKRQQQEQSQDSITIKRCLATPSPRTQSQSHSHLLAALGNPPSQNSGNIPHLLPIPQEQSPPPPPPTTGHPIDLSGRRSTITTGRLKVKQHLVDPNITPRLLKQEVVQQAEAVSSTDKSTHPQLWHPLFGSQKTSYNSPWQWTTVMVNGD